MLQRRHQSRIVQESVHEKNRRQTPQPKRASEHQQIEERTPSRTDVLAEKINEIGDDTCQLCRTNSETAEHVLVKCPGIRDTVPQEWDLPNLVSDPKKSPGNLGKFEG